MKQQYSSGREYGVKDFFEINCLKIRGLKLGSTDQLKQKDQFHVKEEEGNEIVRGLRKALVSFKKSSMISLDTQTIPLVYIDFSVGKPKVVQRSPDSDKPAATGNENGKVSPPKEGGETERD